MRQGTTKKLSSLTFAFFLTVYPALAQSETAAEKPHPVTKLQGVVVQNEATDALERLGLKFRLQEGQKYALLIDQIKLGSPAIYAGLSEGDKVENIAQNNNKIFLSITRGGRNYQCAIEAGNTQLLSAAAVNDFLKGYVTGGGAPKFKIISPTLAKNNVRLPGHVSSPQMPPCLPVFPVGTAPEKILSHCNIELLIDISQSMNEIDGTGNKSKFEWCRDQVRALASALQPYQKTINITIFNNDYTTYEDCDVAEVEQIYSFIGPGMNTGLLAPLLERCHAALRKGRKDNKPTVIAVITDGLPNIPLPPQRVNEALVGFTHELQSDSELNITMLQIGDTFEGSDFCVDLDDNLVKEGAKYDIVDTKTFGELKQINLVQALVDAATHRQSAITKVRRPDDQLGRLKDAPRVFSPTSTPAHFQDNFTHVPVQKSPQLIQQTRDRKQLEEQLLSQ